MIRAGAKLVETASDILEEVSTLKQTMTKKESTQRTEKDIIGKDKIKKAENVTAEAKVETERFQRVLEQVRSQVTVQDVIIAKTALTAAEVSSILLTLELQGYVEAVPGGYRRANTRSEGNNKLCLKF